MALFSATLLGVTAWKLLAGTAIATTATAVAVGYASDKAGELADKTVEPVKKAVKLTALGTGAFYARKVAMATGSPTIKRLANLGTLGAVALMGREVLKGSDKPQEPQAGGATEALAQEDQAEESGLTWKDSSPYFIVKKLTR